MNLDHSVNLKRVLRCNVKFLKKKENIHCMLPFVQERGKIRIFIFVVSTWRNSVKIHKKTGQKERNGADRHRSGSKIS